MNDAPARILVVDDNDINRDTLARRLENIGHVVVEAEDGRIALEKLTQHCIDIVLLDIMMPGLSGFELLAILKEQPNLRNIPVIIISAADDMESVVHGIELGAEDYLSKPFNLPLLNARIKASLGASGCTIRSSAVCKRWPRCKRSIMS